MACHRTLFNPINGYMEVRLVLLMSSKGLVTPFTCHSHTLTALPVLLSFPRAKAHCGLQRHFFSNDAVVIHSFTKSVHLHLGRSRQVRRLCCEKDPAEEEELEKDHVILQNNEAHLSLGVTVALALLSFYRKEISPFLPGSCRFVPSCSEYSMQAYKKYGVVKGTILTAWRLMRCNPLGASGFDPPRWFGESRPPKL